MQEVIEELLNTEANAQKIIQKAREDAENLKSRIENEFSLKIKEEKEEARKMIQREVEKTREESLRKNSEALATAIKQSEALLKDKQTESEKAADEVISLLVTPEYERK
jgi:vacuolar-type H+-ATPase subunit H